MALTAVSAQSPATPQPAEDQVDASCTDAVSGDAVQGRVRKRDRKKAGQRQKASSELPPVLITPPNHTPGPYIFRDGLRTVEPYHFTYNTWCKERWRGRQILEIFQDEFRDRDLSYYRRAIEAGQVQINGKPSTPTQIVKNGDLVSHILHRHEPPISAEPIGIVHESEDMIVINKPSSYPAHPSGRYFRNSVTEVMRAERGYGFNPLPCNRLDRLTSGIMFIAKHPEAAARMTVQLTERSVRKEYVARVRGEFPADEEVVCEQPILQISPKLGLNRIRANGKAAKTVFTRIAYYPGKDPVNAMKMPDGSFRTMSGYSIVCARPLTGRTHQIRVHLQYLGHPIANDPIYSNARVFGPELGAYCSTGEGDDSIMERLSRMGKQEVADAVAWHDEQVESYEKRKMEKLSGEVCPTCATELYTDPHKEELGIWLHSRMYEDAGGAWRYTTGLPKWALDPTQQDAGDVNSVETGEQAVKDAEVAGNILK